MKTLTRLPQVGLVALALTACDSENTPTGPSTPSVPEEVAFSVPISLGDLDSTATSGPTRVEVKLASPRAPLLAREVEVEEPDELFDEEKIESTVVAVESAAGSVVLTLELGGLQIEARSATRFRDEGDGAEMDAATFVARVQAALSAGLRPGIEAKRPPPPQPQDPGDPTFVATRVRLNDESREPEIEMNIDGDNLAGVDTGRAVLTMLGLDIEIDVVGGRTEVERETDAARGEVDFEGLVRTVDVAAERFTLYSGLVVRMADQTRIERDSGNDDRRLASLEAVAEAVAAGALVEAEGEGLPDDAGALLAIEVEFEVEDDHDDAPGLVEFEGIVTSADVTEGLLTLANGVGVRITDRSVFDPDGDLFDLTSVEAALERGFRIEAEGDALPAGPGVVLEALEIKVEVED